MTVDELRALLGTLREQRQAELLSAYQRSLPFNDAIFDRWQRAKELGFGVGTSIYDSSVVMGDVTVGSHTWIGPWTLLDGTGGGLDVGSYCSIASGVHIYTHDTVAWALTGGAAQRRTARVSIASRVYIGGQSIVACGVSIGTQSVVAANSFVNRDVEPNTVVAGTPAVAIGRVEVNGAIARLFFDDPNAIPSDLLPLAQ